VSAPPTISTPILGFFRFIVRGYFRRHFRAVRISGAEALTHAVQGPLIVYANHGSWWDPMVQVLLAAELLPQRRHYAPMDAAALDRYPIFKRLGVFPVALDSPRGAAQFLRTSLTILGENGVLWVTPQGRFADPRERPVLFKPGLAALAARCPKGCTVLPLAIEYPFWNERLPETLLQFGQPMPIHGETPGEVQEKLHDALVKTMDSLQEKSMARDPAAFTLLRRGKVGTGGFYELGQRTLARLRGRRFQPEHSPHQPHKDPA
jgi:1-acyl-sn-glycerol-3-phosphate acyltransferase